MRWIGGTKWIKVGLGLACQALLALPARADGSDARLAAYYDLHLALCGDQVYEWSGTEPPRKGLAGARQVGVGQHNRYALTHDGVLRVWRDDSAQASVVLDRVQSFHAGRSGVLVIRDDATLWKVQTEGHSGSSEELVETPTLIAEDVATASAGDGADYYVTRDGALYVLGRAHRGQYGDGKLVSTTTYRRTAEQVTQVVAHTGHALILKRDGSVWGTGGNIYGPLGRHGHGDKAIRWGRIFEAARAIATGSSHSVAIRADGSLWVWGRGEGLDPKQVLSDVDSVAAGNDTTAALSQGFLWFWKSGAAPRKLMPCG